MLRRSLRALFVVSLSLPFGCSSNPEGNDASASDAGIGLDAPVTDAEGSDGGQPDAAFGDVGARDAEADDALPGDLARPDGEAMDAAPDAGDPADGGDEPDLGAVLCDPSIGLITPMETCSASAPCTRLLPSYTNVSRLDAPIDVPTCATSTFGVDRGRLVADDGPPRSWVDGDGVIRYWCEFRPANTNPQSPRPLIIYAPPSGDSAQGVYDLTSLREKAIDYDLVGDGTRPGFILISAQGRNLRWVTTDPKDGSKFDTFHRDLGTPSDNRDVAFYDHLIDELVSEGVVDSQRIHLMGWSNGGRFAAMYGIARYAQATPGGHHVAAVSVYSAGDPFSNTTHDQDPSCAMSPLPQAALPYFLVSRVCDAIACDEAQAAALTNAGTPPEPGNVAATWIDRLANEIGAPTPSWRLISGVATNAAMCSTNCTQNGGLLNHIRWPDGRAAGDGPDREPELLGHLRDHPRP